MESVTAFERCTDDDSASAWRKKRRTILPRGEAKSDGQVNATGCVLSMPMQRMPVKIKTGNQCRVVPRKPLCRFWSLCETRNPGENMESHQERGYGEDRRRSRPQVSTEGFPEGRHVAAGYQARSGIPPRAGFTSSARLWSNCSR